MIKPDEISLCVCCKKIAEEMELPSDVTVISDLIPDNEVYTVTRDDFLTFLDECGVKATRRKRRKS